MTEVLQIPLTSDPIEIFTIKLDGNTYQIKKQWFELPNAWVLDIEGLSNTVNLKGITLATGVHLLEPFAVNELGILMVVDTEDKGEDPSFEGIGKRWILVYFSKAGL